MKNYLLPLKKQYKANLHCHSTNSDGRFTVEQLKENYKNAGYSILAYSDHNVLIPHTDLKDEAFLPITAIEIDMTEPSDNWVNARTYHINFFSKDENRNQFIHVDRAYDYKVANDIIKRAYTQGFIAQYNHPRWSLQTTEDFLPLEGLQLFEVFNTGCEVEMINGYGDVEYEIMLRNGKYILPAATDDNHNAIGKLDSPYNDSFGGFNMVCMDKLEYEEFFKAIEKGDTYASTGPIINALYTENNKLYIECSPCKTICLRTESRVSRAVKSFGEQLTRAEIDLDLYYDWKYIRIEAIDIFGNKAITRAYTKEEALK